MLARSMLSLSNGLKPNPNTCRSFSTGPRSPISKLSRTCFHTRPQNTARIINFAPPASGDSEEYHPPTQLFRDPSPSSLPSAPTASSSRFTTTVLKPKLAAKPATFIRTATAADTTSDETGLKLYGLLDTLEAVQLGSFEDIAIVVVQHFPFSRKLLLAEQKSWEELGMEEPSTEMGVGYCNSDGLDKDEVDGLFSKPVLREQVETYARLTAEYLVADAVGDGWLRRDKYTKLSRALSGCIEILMRQRKFEKLIGDQKWRDIGVPDEPLMRFPTTRFAKR
ncbi:hypothetical protein BJ508DRAFT_367283 [Ascobolus immersus RN42]|uniref:Uncharacterized protein n=1 Tax=Ascobolus immersus RN42 TaxID=1160509 RepID=A0A3N4HI19_ASCIM|nr:hypothetical protein BJ508DRAFT_367283 [Ascobolus immersus RN42]